MKRYQEIWLERLAVSKTTEDVVKTCQEIVADGTGITDVLCQRLAKIIISLFVPTGDFVDWFHEKTCDNCKHAKMSKYGEVFCHYGIERRFIEDGPQMDADDTCGHWESRWKGSQRNGQLIGG